MESQIRVHFEKTSTGLQPTLNIRFKDSDDPRDELLKSFFELLGGKSSWIEISFDHHLLSSGEKFGKVVYATLRPISDLPSHISECNRRMGEASFENAPVNGNPFNIERNFDELKDVQTVERGHSVLFD